MSSTVAGNLCGDNESLLIELSKQLEDSPLIEAPLLLDPPLLDTSNNNKFWARMFSQQQPPTPSNAPPAAAAAAAAAPKTNAKQSNNSSNPWLDLFADLDPLANPQAFDLKLSGGRRVAEQT